jgi:ATP-dependent DNA ligase
MAFGWGLSELEAACRDRGLVVTGSGKNGKVMKYDYIHALEGWSIDGLRSGGLLLPGCEQIHSMVESPMLAQSQTAFSSEGRFREFIGRGDVIGEEKKDGCRILLSYFRGVGFELYSRNRSVDNFLFCSYVDQVYGWQREVTANIPVPDFIIDGELVSLNPSVNGRMITESVLSAVVSMLGMNRLESHRMQAEAGYPLRFAAFDCLMYNGEVVMGKPLVERKVVLEEVLAKLGEAAVSMGLPQLGWIEGVPVVRGGFKEKSAYFDQVVGRGGEGLVLKVDGEPYNPREARGGMGGGFIKWKRSVSQSVGGDIDAFVTGNCVAGSGKNAGLVGSLEFGVYLVPSGKVHAIASVSGLSDADRAAVSGVGEDGNVRVNPDWVGRVGVIDGQDVSTRSGSFSHARLVRWRVGADMKFPAQCVFDEQKLSELVL